MSNFEKSRGENRSKLRNFVQALALIAALTGASEGRADEGGKLGPTVEVTIDAQRVTPRGEKQIQTETEKNRAILHRIEEKFPGFLESLENMREELKNSGSQLDEAITALENALKNNNIEVLARLKEENPVLWKNVNKIAQIFQNENLNILDEIPGKDGG